MLIWKPTKAKSRTPDENFESRAPASARANSGIDLPFPPDSHIVANVHIVNTAKNVTAMSVTTSGPKARNTGMHANTQTQSSPPVLPPSRDPYT